MLFNNTSVDVITFYCTTVAIFMYILYTLARFQFYVFHFQKEIRVDHYKHNSKNLWSQLGCDDSRRKIDMIVPTPRELCDVPVKVVGEKE